MKKLYGIFLLCLWSFISEQAYSSEEEASSSTFSHLWRVTQERMPGIVYILGTCHAVSFEDLSPVVQSFLSETPFKSWLKEFDPDALSAKMSSLDLKEFFLKNGLAQAERNSIWKDNTSIPEVLIPLHARMISSGFESGIFHLTVTGIIAIFQNGSIDAIFPKKITCEHSQLLDEDGVKTSEDMLQSFKVLSDDKDSPGKERVVTAEETSSQIAKLLGIPEKILAPINFSSVSTYPALIGDFAHTTRHFFRGVSVSG